MSAIQIQSLTFTYPSKSEPVFDHLNLVLDSSWKLGFTGRNGKGKTTLFKILEASSQEYPDPLYSEYSGNIYSGCRFCYFPYEIKHPDWMAIEALSEVLPDLEDWKLMRELNLMNMDCELLYRIFSSLSPGEQTRILLAALFAQNEASFLLMDEPTNHLDQKARQEVSRYLNFKKGFIVISHDQAFLDGCIDHVLAFNKNSVQVQKGNLSQYLESRENLKKEESSRKIQLQKEIRYLDKASQNTASWSAKAEKAKNGNGPVDRGFISHKAAKVMKRSKSMQKRQSKALDEKKSLLNDFEEISELKLHPLSFTGRCLIQAENLQLGYKAGNIEADDRDGTEKSSGQMLFEPVNFTLMPGERLWLQGDNGTGKSSLLHWILNPDHPGMIQSGTLARDSRLVISYLEQDSQHLAGNLDTLCRQKDLDADLVRAILIHLGFSRELLFSPLESMSLGQKKKVLIALSLAKPANLYIWDEPLNYLDLESRLQLEEVLKNNPCTMIFVEHDAKFGQDISTDQLILKQTEFGS